MVLHGIENSLRGSFARILGRRWLAKRQFIFEVILPRCFPPFVETKNRIMYSWYTLRALFFFFFFFFFTKAGNSKESFPLVRWRGIGYLNTPRWNERCCLEIGLYIGARKSILQRRVFIVKIITNVPDYSTFPSSSFSSENRTHKGIKRNETNQLLVVIIIWKWRNVGASLLLWEEKSFERIFSIFARIS